MLRFGQIEANVADLERGAAPNDGIIQVKFDELAILKVGAKGVGKL